MNITFEIEEKNTKVKILGNGKLIGHIFTPSGSGHDTPNSIQVCGFDDAFDLWWCGLFGDGKGIAKKDIQLFFNENSRLSVGVSNECLRCFNNPCTCKDMRIKTFAEVIEGKI